MVLFWCLLKVEPGIFADGLNVGVRERQGLGRMPSSSQEGRLTSCKDGAAVLKRWILDEDVKNSVLDCGVYW